MASKRRSSVTRSAASPGRLRIIGGRWRRRLLPVAAVEGLRPTAERIRETLFNWLAPDLEGARCLDLCAGTGALGLEALSRGAAGAVFVETSRVAADTLENAVAMLGATHAEIVCAAAEDWLVAATPRKFDIVFLDPPYRAAALPDLCRLLQEYGWLTADAHIYLEHDRHQPAPALPEQWRTLKDKVAGNVRYRLLTVASP